MKATRTHFTSKSKLAWTLCLQNLGQPASLSTSPLLQRAEGFAQTQSATVLVYAAIYLGCFALFLEVVERAPLIEDLSWGQGSMWTTIQREGQSVTMGGVGPQYMVWSATTEGQFHECEAVLLRQSSHTRTTAEKQFMMVEGRDPDGAPVIVTYPGPDTVARTEIIPRMYGW